MTPTLTTKRLTLRRFELQDFPDYAAFLASEDARYMDGPFDRKQAWSMFCEDTAGWALKGYGCLMVTLQDSTEVLGSVGIQQPPNFPEIEMGWMLYPKGRGQGYATEAAAALRDYVLDRVQIASLVSYVDPANTGSIAVAERLGATPDPNALCPANDNCLVFRHPIGKAA